MIKRLNNQPSPIGWKHSEKLVEWEHVQNEWIVHGPQMHGNICDDDAGIENYLHIHTIIIMTVSVQLLIVQKSYNAHMSTVSTPRSLGSLGYPGKSNTLSSAQSKTNHSESGQCASRQRAQQYQHWIYTSLLIATLTTICNISFTLQ